MGGGRGTLSTSAIGVGGTELDKWGMGEMHWCNAKHMPGFCSAERQSTAHTQHNILLCSSTAPAKLKLLRSHIPSLTTCTKATFAAVTPFERDL